MYSLYDEHFSQICRKNFTVQTVVRLKIAKLMFSLTLRLQLETLRWYVRWQARILIDQSRFPLPIRMAFE
jgi:hypothetical protein